MSMQLTSSAANKMIKALTEKKNSILRNERMSSTYQRSATDKAVVIPSYDYSETRESISNIDTKIMKIKHAVNLYNTATVAYKGFTIDQLLVKLAQLSNEKEVISGLKGIQEVSRSYNGIGNVSVDTVRNYDSDAASEDYDFVVNEISKIQMAIDLANLTEKITIDI
jgi:hypothetical protein